MCHSITISNLGNIFNPSNNIVDENDTAVITSRLNTTHRKLNFTIVAITTYDGNPEPLSVSSEACFRFMYTGVNIVEVDEYGWVVFVFFVGVIIGVVTVVIVHVVFVVLMTNEKTSTIAPALVAAVMGKVRCLLVARNYSTQPKFSTHQWEN